MLRKILDILTGLAFLVSIGIAFIVIGMEPHRKTSTATKDTIEVETRCTTVEQAAKLNYLVWQQMQQEVMTYHSLYWQTSLELDKYKGHHGVEKDIEDFKLREEIARERLVAARRAFEEYRKTVGDRLTRFIVLEPQTGLWCTHLNNE